MFEYKVDDNISLKLLNKSDAEDLYALINSNRLYLRQWLSWLDKIKEVNDTVSFINNTRDQFANNNGFQAGILVDQKLTGIIGLHEIDWEDKKTEIGYWIDQNYQGRGIITKACKALLDYLFNRLKLNKVEIHCAEQNTKSQQIPLKLGFVREGLIREAQWLYDHYVNLVIYGLLASEYVNRDDEKC